ncbi:MAG: leucine--tRNA ligase, partial [Calditrichaeota bacterium]|nr:leucine--tRNA ligase [Calditrichota bacterium]
MNFSEIEKKWQKRWAEAKLYQSKLEQNKDNAYVLVMFSYPSGDKLHVGHWYNFGPTDTYARFLRMTGKNVFEPMGFDAFGLPAENYAIKTGIHPAISTKKNISVMTEQLKAIGAMYDWDKTLVTCDESYYKWNQWLFLQLYKKGLAYRKEAPVNWCPKDKTVLANEQVINGCCERCDTKVIRKNLTQWFFKITEYAEQLLDGLNVINWPESTKAKQREWIGKSHGAEIVFSIKDSDQTITAFTTRPDTLFGATYLTLAPEHDILNTIVSPEQKDKVQQYQVESSQRSEIDRLSDQNKTGVFTGAYAINPINGEEMPIWISDYVLSTYGTGAIMAVPAHDQRDFDFAKKFDLKIKQVINPHGESIADKVIEQAYTEDGNLINSEEFDGLTIANAKEKIVQSLASAGKAVAKTNYKLRDWLISRQRYWGTPIPIIYCDDCGAVPVAETDLPVKLPLDVEFHPDGDSPLKNSSSFQNVSCPKCGKAASRETDTMDTFVCSSWYYLRYLDPTNDNEAINSDLANRWTPVDMYVGGADHAVMHLLYARFIHKALRDMGHVNSDEPFK